MAKKKKDLPEVKPQKGDSSARFQAIKLAMDQIEKQYGKGSIMRFGEKSSDKLTSCRIQVGNPKQNQVVKPKYRRNVH